MEKIKTIALFVLLLYIFFQHFCGKGTQPCPEIVQETIDTQRLYRQWASAWSKPNPDTIILPGKRMPAPQPDTIYVPGEPYVIVEPVDTAAILQDYYAKVVYKDSSAITDSTELNYGTAYVSDTVSQNRIQARQWSFKLSLPVITKTVTVSEKPRVEVYAGGNAMFAPTGAIGGKFSLTIKDKKDQQYEFGGGRFAGHWFGEIGTKFKLSFRNK